jgi:hypothetical protein
MGLNELNEAGYLFKRHFDMSAPQTKTGKPNKRGTGWTLVCRLVLFGLGTFFFGAAVYHYFDQDRQWSSGLIVLASMGVIFIGMGIFTSAKICEKIAESI